MSRSVDRLVAALGIALVLATGGVALLSDKAGSSGASAGATPVKFSKRSVDVGIKDFKYMPPSIEVKVGTKVTFVNDDNAGHTATSKTVGAFDSGSIAAGESGSVVLKKAGDFDYFCGFHAYMKAKIRVVK